MEEERKENTALVPSSANELVAVEEKPGYWARVARRYLWTFRVVLIFILVFAVLFASLCSSAFSGDGIYYFAKDVTSVHVLAGQDRDTIHYAYGEPTPSHAAFRGGVATVYDRGIEVLSSAGEPLLTAERAFAAPASAISRNYLLAYDHGGTAFSVCNAYDELYRGNTMAPIVLGVVSDAGVFVVVTAAVTENEIFYPSEILLYNSNFELAQRFKRSGATISVALSADGRYIAVLYATDEGTGLDIYARKATKPQTSLTFDGFPYAVGFTSANTVAVLTDLGCHTLRTDGKRYQSVSFDGQSLLCYDMGKNAVAVAIRSDVTLGRILFMSLDKKGKIKYREERAADVYGISVIDRTAWILTGDSVMTVDLRRGVVRNTIETESGAIGVAGVDRYHAKVFYPAFAVEIKVKK